MTVEERRNFGIDAPVFAPVRFSPGAVVFFDFVGDAEFVQLVRQGLNWNRPDPDSDR